MCPCLRSNVRWLGAGAGLAAAAYAAYAGITWCRYGHPSAPAAGDDDPLLDRFIPEYDVVERHRTLVAAPAAVTFAVAREIDLLGLPLVRPIFKAREVILGATPDRRPRPQGLLAEVQSLGWMVLAEEPDREVVVGAATRPWEPNVTFRGVPPDKFAAFAEPGYVKIAWSIRAHPTGPSSSIFRTETRVIATDADARMRFRRYWSLLSPGILLIRWLALGPIKTEAERRSPV
jgi:hypothetical protein